MTKILFLICSLMTSFVSAKSFDELKIECLKELKQVQGWCPESKALHMMDLIAQTKPDICVEIGVFGGSSILPTVKALKHNQKGVVYAIDPWDKQACLSGYEPNDPNYQWWSQVDLEGIYLGFCRMLKRGNFNPYCVVLRETSAQALTRFKEETIDILHIDGNHTKDAALFDAKTYLPKVKKGGYIWFDDVNWRSTNAAVEFLEDHCDYVEEYSTEAYVLFRKKA